MRVREIEYTIASGAVFPLVDFRFPWFHGEVGIHLVILDEVVVVEEFAVYGGEGDKKIVLVSQTQSKGTDSAFLSEFYQEEEILVSKDARYIVESIKEEDNVKVLDDTANIIYLYLKEIGG